MRAIVESLYALQQIALQKSRVTPEQEAKVRLLRKKVPLPVLGHFDRIVARGQRGVALVRHGVCCECHVRVSAGTAASLVHPKDIYICESCGRYLLLAPEEMPGAGEGAGTSTPDKPAKKATAATA